MCSSSIPRSPGEVFADKGSDNSRAFDNSSVAGVVVNLLDSQGDVIATTTTDARGVYTFKDPGLGTFTVQAVAPQGTTLEKSAPTVSITKAMVVNDVNIGLKLLSKPGPSPHPIHGDPHWG